jgi:SWI/SNF-related matrix-associated actin-dependent regulator of chromatin subfamily A member 5
VLTGTPVQNNLVELWGLLHWLYPSVFVSATERLFKEAFNLDKGTYSLPFLSAAKKLLAAVMLRRTKDTVEIQVPPREETTIFLPMVEAQRFWTYRLLTRLDTLDLTEIFGANTEDDKENAGRKEIKAHLAAQLEQGKTGQQHRAFFLSFSFLARATCETNTEVLIFRVEKADESSNTAPPDM